MEWLGNKAAQHKDNQDDGKKAAHVVGKMRIVFAGLAFFQTAFMDCPNNTGEHDKHQQYGGKAHKFGQNAEYADHAQEITPLQAGAPFAVFLTLFAAFEVEDQAGQQHNDCA